MKMTIQYSLDKIEEAAKKLISSCNTKILLFQGPMGSGKTTLISAILKVLGCDSKASSPSFSIVNEYPLEDDIVYHFDFYRVKISARHSILESKNIFFLVIGI